MRRTLPIRARMTLYYSAVLAVILAGLGVFLVVELRSALRDRAHDSLEAAFRPLAERLATSAQVDLARELHGSDIPNESDLEVIGQILDGNGRVLRSSGERATATAMVGRDVLARAAREGHWHEPRRLPGRAHDDLVVVVPIRSGPLAGGFVALAQTLRSADQAVHRLVLLLLIAAPAALALALAGGWRIARTALGPVDSMTRTAAAIDAVHASERLPEPARDDELGRLARTLNGMLERLDGALTRERRFAADASHELRSPLGVMAAELDVALRGTDPDDDAHRVLGSVRDEVGRLSRTVENLLVLSRADSLEGFALARHDTDLLDLAIGVVSRLQPLADERTIALGLDGAPAHAHADAELLALALRNLVENAIKHSADGARVMVEVTDGAAPAIAVSDTGPGIPAEDLPHVFDRFYRVDRARGRETGGSGLGLAIARTIAEAHGGTIDVASAPGAGATFTLRIG